MSALKIEMAPEEGKPARHERRMSNYPKPQTTKPTPEPAQPTKPSRELITIKSIERDVGLNFRSGGIREALAKEYAEVLAALPPITLFRDEAGKLWLADGWHRVRAYEIEKKTEIPAKVHKGTRRDALLHAAGANVHGAKRTNKDKRKAVTVLLSDQEWSKKSDAWIAERCAVSDRFVAGMRPPTPNGSGLIEREGKDGKKRKVSKKPKTNGHTKSKEAPNPEKAAAAIGSAVRNAVKSYRKRWPAAFLADVVSKIASELKGEASAAKDGAS